MHHQCAKFGDFSFSRFGFIMRANRQTHTERESQTDAAKRLTHATAVERRAVSLGYLSLLVI